MNIAPTNPAWGSPAVQDAYAAELRSVAFDENRRMLASASNYRRPANERKEDREDKSAESTLNARVKAEANADEYRRELLAVMTEGKEYTAADLARALCTTGQAIARRLTVLEQRGVVSGRWKGVRRTDGGGGTRMKIWRVA